MPNKPSEEILNSDQLSQALARLSLDQIRFCVSRQEHGTDKEAAIAADIKPGSVYQWRHKGVPIDEVLNLMACDGLITALEIRKRNLTKAMLVKVDGLDSDDERIQQGTSTEIIEWEMGKAAQPLDHTVAFDLESWKAKRDKNRQAVEQMEEPERADTNRQD